MKANGMDGVRELLRALGREMGEALGSALVEAVQAQLPRLREELGTARPATPTRRASSERGAKVSASLTRPCPVTGCDRPGRGPRYSFLCDVHRDLPAGEREQYRVRPKR